MKLFNLISSFFSVVLLFLASDITLRFGVYGGLILCGAFFTASLVLYLFKNQLFDKKDTATKRLLIYVALFFYFLETVFLSCWVVLSVLPFINFEYSSIASTLMVLFFFFFLSLSVLMKKTSELAINSFTFINLLIVFMMAIFLSNTIYLQKGLETVYHNLLHYHPSMLHESKEGMAGMYVMLTLLFFVRQYVIYSLQALGNKKFVSHMFLVNFCVGSIMLAFSTMVLVAVTERVESTHPNVLIVSMLQKLMNPYIFSVVWTIFILASLISILLTWVSIKKYIRPGTVVRPDLYVWILVAASVCGFQVFHLENAYLIDIILFFSIWLIPPSIFLLTSSWHQLSKIQLIASLPVLYVASGAMLYFHIPMLVQLLSAAGGALLFSTLSLLVPAKSFGKVK
ncbi:hypothetical protein [Planococcus sp. YIM B11945]|uniref:hypothetical protein n=1 Tax=Planococcus sp. YIM B11945 TaxID=3435410 RepID=UPI003D7C6F42